MRKWMKFLVSENHQNKITKTKGKTFDASCVNICSYPIQHVNYSSYLLQITLQHLLHEIHTSPARPFTQELQTAVWIMSCIEKSSVVLNHQ